MAAKHRGQRILRYIPRYLINVNQVTDVDELSVLDLC
jgi:hypothetical protein